MATPDHEDSVEIDDDLAEALDERADDVLDGEFVTPDEHDERRSE